MIKFKIFDRTFQTEEGLMASGEFIVKSALKDYTVQHVKDRDIYETINEKEGRNFIFCDKNVFTEYKKNIKGSHIFLGEADEGFKTMDGVMMVIDFIRKENFTKEDRLIVIGGGITQDVAAFVGATFKRGITWYFFPTTLLAMCDSCIGAKSSINYKGAKNQLGLFSAPDKIIINSDFIESLDNKNISNGLGEILKLYIIGGKKFISLYNQCVEKGKIKDKRQYKDLIIGALQIKKVVIEEDEFDLNYRKSLNYGHTLGHAIETLSSYQIPHGQAVAVGMIIANEMSARRGILGAKTNEDINKLIAEILDKETVRIIKKIKIKDIEDLLLKDKKTMGKKVNFIVIKDIGDTRTLSLDVSRSLVDEIEEIVRCSFGKGGVSASAPAWVQGLDI